MASFCSGAESAGTSAQSSCMQMALCRWRSALSSTSERPEALMSSTMQARSSLCCGGAAWIATRLLEPLMRLRASAMCRVVT